MTVRVLDFQRKLRPQLRSFFKQAQYFDLFQKIKPLDKSSFEKIAAIWMQIALKN